MWLRIYTWTKFPFVPIYGGFPVKLVTYVGKPIPYDGNLTPEELQLKVNNYKIDDIDFPNNIKYLKIFEHFQVANALRNLMKEHQIIPGNITRALLERIRTIHTIER